MSEFIKRREFQGYAMLAGSCLVILAITLL